MKISTKLCFAVVGGCLFASVQASAVTLFLQPGSGHKFINGTGLWSNQFVTDQYLEIQDGRRIFIDTPFFGSTPVSRTWVVPIPLDATAVNWTTVTSDFFSGGDYSQRICTFTFDGFFSTCGASVGHNSSSTAFVPNGGTAYDQLVMASRNDATGLTQGSPAVSTIKASR